MLYRSVAACFLLLLPMFSRGQEPVLPKGIKTVLRGHTGPIAGTAFSNDGSLALTAGFDESVRLWDADTGELIRTFAGQQGHKGLVLGAAFAPDMQTFASVGTDNQLRIWEIPARKPLRETALGAPLTCSAVTADGKLAAFGDTAGNLHLIDPSSGTVRKTIPAHRGAVIAVTLRNDAALLQSIGSDGMLRFWNAEGVSLGSVHASEKPLTATAYNPNNGTALTLAEESVCHVWTVPTANSLPKALPAVSGGLRLWTINRDGNRIAAVTADGLEARVINSTDGQVLRSIQSSGRPISAVLLNTNGETLWLGHTDGSVSTWGADGKEIGRFVAHTASVTGLAIAGDARLLGTVGADGAFRVRHIKPSAAKRFEQPAKITALALRGDGKRFITGGADHVVRLWKVTETIERQFTGASSPLGSVSSAGDLLAAGESAGVLRFWRLSDGKPLGAFQVPNGIIRVAVLPGTDRAAVVTADGQIALYALPAKAEAEPTKPSPTKPLWTADAKGVVDLHPRPQGDSLVASGDGIMILDTKTGSIRRTVKLASRPAALALSADGLRWAAADANGFLHLGSVDNVDPPKTYPLIGKPASLAFQPDGKRLVVGLLDERIALYELSDAAPILLATQPTKGIPSLLGFPGGDTNGFLVGGADKQVELLELPIVYARQLEPPGNELRIVALNSGGDIVTWGKTSGLRLRSLSDGREVREFAFPGPIVAVQPNRNGDRIAVAGTDRAVLFATNDGRALQSLSSSRPIRAIGLNADGTRILIAADDPLVHVYDAGNGKRLQGMRTDSTVLAIAALPNSNSFLLATASGTQEHHPFLHQKSFSLPAIPRASTIAPNGTILAFAGDGNDIHLLNTTNGTIERTLQGNESLAVSLTIARDSQRTAALGADGLIRMFTANDGRYVGLFKPTAPIRRIAFPASNSVLTAIAADRTLIAWNTAFQTNQDLPTEFGQPLQVFPHPVVPECLCTTDTGLVLTGAGDGTARLWKPASETPIAVLPHPNILTAVRYSPDGSRLAVASLDGFLRLYGVPKRDLQKQISAIVKPPETRIATTIYAIEWMKNSKQLFTAGYDGAIKLWDAETGNLLREFKSYEEKASPKGHRDQVFCIARTPDDKYLVSGSSDRSLKLWDVATGQVIREFIDPALPKTSSPTGGEAIAHPGWIHAVAVSADGRFLVSGGAAPKLRGRLVLWELPSGKLLRAWNLDTGPILSLAYRPGQETLLIGCGTPNRTAREVSAFLLPVTGNVP